MTSSNGDTVPSGPRKQTESGTESNRLKKEEEKRRRMEKHNPQQKNNPRQDTHVDFLHFQDSAGAVKRFKQRKK